MVHRNVGREPSCPSVALPHVFASACSGGLVEPRSECIACPGWACSQSSWPVISCQAWAVSPYWPWSVATWPAIHRLLPMAGRLCSVVASPGDRTACPGWAVLAEQPRIQARSSPQKFEWGLAYLASWPSCVSCEPMPCHERPCKGIVPGSPVLDHRPNLPNRVQPGPTALRESVAAVASGSSWSHSKISGQTTSSPRSCLGIVLPMRRANFTCPPQHASVIASLAGVLPGVASVSHRVLTVGCVLGAIMGGDRLPGSRESTWARLSNSETRTAYRQLCGTTRRPSE
jgi:hypothetical protein